MTYFPIIYNNGSQIPTLAPTFIAITASLALEYQ